MSDDLATLLGEADPDKLGIGRHMIEAYCTEAWTASASEDSQIRAFLRFGPTMMADTGRHEFLEVLRGLPEHSHFHPELTERLPEFALAMEPATELPLVSVEKLDYTQGDLPTIDVSYAYFRINDHDGSAVGNLAIYGSALPARVLALVARGDRGMFERMERLVEPGRRQAAVLFADLEDSSVLSRKLPSSAYFRLIRAITTAMDGVIIERSGIVGKHAGDGVSAFFLADDLGSPSQAAAAAIAAAREMTEAAGRAAKEVAEDTGLFDVVSCVINVGVHWGGRLYMGQLVTGGRLEVTALGDEVNECARIQDAARGGRVLASKSLIEHLTDDDARALTLDPEGVVYTTVADLPGVSEKAVRDAGGIPITAL